MKAGRLRHRVTIQNFTTTRDEYGQPITKWENGATVWATVSAISSRERLAAGAEMGETSIRVWLRYRADITAASRLLCRSGPFAGEILEVTAPPVPDEKGTRLEIACGKGVKHA